MQSTTSKGEMLVYQDGKMDKCWARSPFAGLCIYDPDVWVRWWEANEKRLKIDAIDDK